LWALAGRRPRAGPGGGALTETRAGRQRRQGTHSNKRREPLVNSALHHRAILAGEWPVMMCVRLQRMQSLAPQSPLEACNAEDLHANREQEAHCVALWMAREAGSGDNGVARCQRLGRAGGDVGSACITEAGHTLIFKQYMGGGWWRGAQRSSTSSASGVQRLASQI